MVAAAVMAYSFLLCGYFFPPKDLSAHLVWMPFTSYLYYPFNGALTAIYSWNRKTLECPEGPSARKCPFTTGTQVLRHYSIDENLFHVAWPVLLCTTVALWIAAYSVFSFRVKWRF